MAYYSGQASSYQELLNVLVNACVEQGWTWADGILSKDNLFIKLTISKSGNTETGIAAQGGTGKSSGSLINPAITYPRMGSPTTPDIPNFPANYHIFIFATEVYFLAKFELNKFLYLAFGKSSVQLHESGLWISATACLDIHYNTGGIVINPYGGGSNYSPLSAVAPFWSTADYTYYGLLNSNSIILHGLDGMSWSYGGSWAYRSALTTFVSQAQPLINRQPSNWFTNAILLPFHVFMNRLGDKKSLVCDFQHSRFLRIDHYDPEQIITLGSDRWMIFPFYKKNITTRNGGTGIDHTGTFGWAIRYDGP